MTDSSESSGRTHADGSPCPEGTTRLPRTAKVCCAEFAARTRACYFDIRYEWWPRPRGWFTIIPPDAGGGGVAMNFCPHCGQRLPGVKRHGRYLEV